MVLEKRFQYQLTVDCVVFGYADNIVHIALIKRKNPPFIGMWALPGGFLEGAETVEEAARRELKEETGIAGCVLEQFHVFSDLHRDPRGRVITLGLFALIKSEDSVLIATNDAEQAQWFPLYDIPPLAFDHEAIYAHAIDALRRAITIKPLLFELLPKEFTLSELQNIYEQIYDRTLDKRNFRKKVQKMDFIQETKNITQGNNSRPARLYTFNKKRYLTLSKNTITY